MDEEKPKKKHKKNWREEYASVTDIETFLSDRIMLRYNVVTRRVEYRLVLSQYGLVCWEELDTMQQKELNKLKAAMTMPSINHDAIYAQAYRLYCDGFRFWFDRQEIERLSHHNRQFETARLEHELVQQYFRIPKENEPGEFLPVAMALQIVGAGITQKLSTVLLGRAFSDFGFQKKTYKNVRGYIVVRRSAEEMRSMRNMMACYDPHTDTDDTDDS